MSEIILRERVIAIKANDTWDQALQGNVLRVTVGAVPLRVQTRDGHVDFTLLAGEVAEFPGEFPGLVLSHSSGADQVFTVQVGKGVNVASALLSGTVTISGTPTVINGGGTLTSITNTVKTSIDPITYGASFKSTVLRGANDPETIVAPGANVNGIIVHQALAISKNAGTGIGSSYLTKASAPASINDGNVIASPGTIGFFTSAYLQGIDLKRSVLIPAGLGLYFICTFAEQDAQRSVLYTLL